MNIAYGHLIDESPHHARDIELTDQELCKHSVRVGGTGTGKTAQIKCDIYQHIENGTGFTVIDPEEVLVNDILKYLAAAGWPPEKLVLINPLYDRVVPFNVLSAVEHPFTVVEDILAAMHRSWPQNWGPRLEDIGRHGFRLFQRAGLTLAEFPRFLSDEQFRLAVVREHADESETNFFTYHLGNIGKVEYRRWVESVRNKISAFVESPFTQPMLAAEGCFDLRVAHDEGYAVLACFPERVMRDSARLMAMLMISRIYSAALRRPEGARIHHNYLDEYQTFVSRSTSELLARSRKRGNSMHLALQSLQQIQDESTIAVMLGNTAAQVFFQLGREDAELAAKFCFPASGTTVKRGKKHWLWGEQGEPRFFSVQEEQEHFIRELMNQEVRECVVRLRDRGETYFAHTYDLPAASDAGVATLVEKSLEIHAVPKAEIEAARRARLARYEPRRRMPD